MRVAACEMEHMPRFCVIYREVIPTSKIEKPHKISEESYIESDNVLFALVQ